MRFARVFVLSLTSQPMGSALVMLKPFTRQGLEKQLESLTSGQYIRDLLSALVTEKKGRLTVEFAMDQAAYQRLKSRVLGKRVLFTTNPELTDDEIVFGYRGQHHVERAFRDMKDPCFIRFSPAFHRTDSMIRFRAFHCVLALTLLSLVHREVVTAGIEMSQRRMLQDLTRITEITNYYAAHTGKAAELGGIPRAERTLTRLSPQKVEDLDTSDAADSP